jgi:hypothetical protein
MAWLRNTSSFANSSEHRKYADGVLEEELGPMYTGAPQLSWHILWRCSQAFVEQYPEGVAQDANQDDVLSWFADSSEKLASFAVGQALNSTHGKA